MRARSLLVCALFAGAWIAAWPALAPAADDVQVYPVPPSMVGKHNGECKRLTRMIAHYADVADQARDRGDEMWRDAMLQHISHLSERRAELCPTLYAQKPIGPELAKILKGAARIAAKLFTMGLI